MHCNGITKSSVSNTTILSEIKISAYHASAYHDGLVFTNPEGHCVSYMQNNNQHVRTLIGNGCEGNSDGLASKSRPYQPCGITVEHDNIIYFSDIRLSTVKICTPLQLTAEFLENTGKIYEAFSIHAKGMEKVRYLYLNR